jgi:hypothetical protein
MMQGRVVLRDDDDYARTRQIWNRAVEYQPALFAVCETIVFAIVFEIAEKDTIA